MRESITDDRYVDCRFTTMDEPPNPAVSVIDTGVWAYRDFTIHFDPPPIPSREADYSWCHDDYDGTPNYENAPTGHAASLEDACDEIDAWYEEQKP